jgi:hypothetical protein
LRATTSEQIAAAHIDLGAAREPMLAQDPMTAHGAMSPRTDPVMGPADEPVVAPRQQAAPSPTLSPAGSPTGRGQPNSLFAPAQKIATVSAPPPRPATSEPHRSLFGRVTGVLGFRHIAEPDVRTEAAASAETAPASEQVGPTVRQTTAEDIGIGIPKFLLRQTSGAAAPQRR